MAYPACLYAEQILDSGESDSLKNYVDGINELFYISEYAKFHDYIMNRIEEEGHFQLVCEQKRQQSGMIQPLIHHVFTTQGIIEDLVDSIVAHEVVTNDMSKEIHQDLSYRQKRHLICSHINGFDHEGDFKSFVNIRNRLAHDRGKQLQFGRQSSAITYENPAKVVRDAKELVDKLCQELYGLNVHEIMGKTPDSHKGLMTKGVLSENLGMKEHLPDVSTLDIIEWCIEEMDGDGNKWGTVKQELEDRGYDPKTIEEAGGIRTLDANNELSWSQELSDCVSFSYFDINTEIIEFKTDIQEHDVEASFAYLKINDTYLRRVRNITDGETVSFDLPVPNPLDFGRKNLLEVGVGIEKDMEVGGDRLRILDNNGSLTYQEIN